MTLDLYPHHEDRPDCRDSQGKIVSWHTCEWCGECHIVDCPNSVVLCEMAVSEVKSIELERKAEQAWSQIAR